MFAAKPRTAVSPQVEREPPIGVAEVLRETHSLNRSVSLIDTDQVRENLALLRSRLPPANLLYNLTASDDPAVLLLMKELGINFSFRSQRHVDRLKALGIPTSKCLFVSSLAGADVPGVLESSGVESFVVGNEFGLNELLRPGYASGALGRMGPSRSGEVIALVATNPDQPFFSPTYLWRLNNRMLQTGFRRLGVAVHLEKDLHEDKSYWEGIGALMKVTPPSNFPIRSVSILGGLIGGERLKQVGRTKESYLNMLYFAAFQVPGVFLSKNYLPDFCMNIEVGDFLLGDSITYSPVLNTSVRHGKRCVVMGSTLYGDVAAHMFRGERIDVEAVPQTVGTPPGPLVESVVFDGCCDVGRLNEKAEERQSPIQLPSSIRSGDWLGLKGHRISEGATRRFNGLPSATTVLFRPSEGLSSLRVSPAHEVPDVEFRHVEKWLAGLDALRIRRIVRSLAVEPPCTEDQLSARLVHAGREYVRRNPNLPGSFVLLDIEAHVHQWRALRTALRGPKHAHAVDECYRAKKSCDDPIPAVIDAVLGYGVDGASAEEYRDARAAGTPPERVVISHCHKSADTLREMKAHPPFATVFDSFSELQRLVDSGLDKNTVLMVRIEVHSTSATNTGVKFGVPPHEAIELIANARDNGFSKLGVAFHVGFMAHDPQNFDLPLSQCLDLAEAAKKRGIILTHFDIGGGFGSHATLRGHETTLPDLLAGTAARVSAFRIRVERVNGARVYILAEPGRATALCGAKVLRIAGESSNFYEFDGDPKVLRRLILEDTVAGLDSDRVHDGARHRTFALEIDERPDESYDGIVVGMSGAGNDIVGVDREFRIPTSIARRAGGFTGRSWVIAPGAGLAYAVNSASGNFNGMRVGGVVAYAWQNGSLQFFESPLMARDAVFEKYLAEWRGNTKRHW